LLTRMTGISLHMQWPLTSQLIFIACHYIEIKAFAREVHTCCNFKRKKKPTSVFANSHQELDLFDRNRNIVCHECEKRNPMPSWQRYLSRR
jgi:hypothetical protein